MIGRTHVFSGVDKDRVKPVQLRKRMSVGLIWKMPSELAHLFDNTDVAEHFGIVQYVPPVPEALLRVAMPLIEAKTTYSIERLRTYPTLLVDDEIVITEKLEGENLQATYYADGVREGLFGGGRVSLTTKGLGEKGLVFRDVPEAYDVPIIRAAMSSGIVEKLIAIAGNLADSGGLADHARIRLFAEAIGPGVKKLHYNGSAPFARVLDIRVDDQWFDEDQKAAIFAAVDLERAPFLYRGPFDAAVVESFREGQTTIGGKHIREGVVITAVGSQEKRLTALGDEIRPILKAHSDAFLRKFDHD